MAGKSKSMSKGSLPGGGAKGGSGHMFGRQSADPRKPGITGKPGRGGVSGGKWGKGGGTGFVGKQGSSTPAVKGRVSVAKR